MTAMPPSPFLTDSAVPMPSTADTAVASNQHPHAQGATAGPFDESSSSAGGCQEAPAASAPNAEAAGLTDHIHEIFHYARKLVTGNHRFVLDEAAFMEAIEEPPLFLRRGRA